MNNLPVRPLVICYEGIDGCGKGTQISKMVDWFEHRDRQPVKVIDPGQGMGGRAIRDILLDKSVPLTPVQQTLLYTAARISGRDAIVEHQKAGHDVVLDRWVMSTAVYQGLVQQVKSELIWGLQQECVGFQPDLYIVLDLPANVAAYRLAQANTKEGDPVPDADRFESKGVVFAERLRGGYRKVAEHNDKCCIIDAEQSPEDTFNDILDVCRERIDGFYTIEMQNDSDR